MSISMARVQKRGRNTLRGTAAAILQSRPSATPVESHECLARGWNVNTNDWKRVRWPALDKDFAAAEYENTACVWQIQSSWNVDAPEAT